MPPHRTLSAFARHSVFLFAIFTLAPLTGCGGGGGGGGGATPTNPNPPTNPVDPAPTPSVGCSGVDVAQGYSQTLERVAETTGRGCGEVGQNAAVVVIETGPVSVENNLRHTEDVIRLGLRRIAPGVNPRGPEGGCDGLCQTVRLDGAEVPYLRLNHDGNFMNDGVTQFTAAIGQVQRIRDAEEKGLIVNMSISFSLGTNTQYTIPDDLGVFVWAFPGQGAVNQDGVYVGTKRLNSRNELIAGNSSDHVLAYPTDSAWLAERFIEMAASANPCGTQGDIGCLAVENAGSPSHAAARVSGALAVMQEYYCKAAPEKLLKKLWDASMESAGPGANAGAGPVNAFIMNLDAAIESGQTVDADGCVALPE